MGLIPGYLYSLFTSALWAISCVGLGLLVTARLKNLTRLESCIFSFITGCAIWLVISLILLAFGIFKPFVLIALLYLTSISSLVLHGRKWFSDIRNGFKPDIPILCLIIAIGAQMLYAFLPITAFDALFYHLPLANLMLETGTITWTPWILYSSIPQGYEIFQAIGLASGGDVGANLVSWWFGLATVITLIAIGGRLGNRQAGLWAAVALSITPMWFWLCHVPYIESILAFGFCFFALCMMIKPPGWVIGIAVGFLCGTKYWGIEVATIGFVLWILQCRPSLKSVASAISIACVIALFWYARNIALFANPFFPYYNEYFSFLGDPKIEGALDTIFVFPRDKASPQTIIGWIQLPFKLIINPVPEYSDDPSLTWKHIGWLSIFWSPAIFILLKKNRDAVVVYAYALIAIFSWLVIHQIAILRYLTAILPIMYIMAILFISHMLSRIRINRKSRKVFSYIALVLVILQLIGPTTNRGLIQIPFTSEERNLYLEVNVDGFSAINALNRIDPPPHVYFLYGEGVKHYCKFSLYAGWNDPYGYYKFLNHTSSGEELANWLCEIGVDVLLVNERRVRQIESDPMRLQKILQDDAFTSVYSPRYLHYKPTPDSISEVSMYVRK